MLANFGGDDRLAFMGRFPQLANGQLWHDFLFVLRIIQAVGRPPALDPRPPFFMVRGAETTALQDRDQLLHHPANISDDRQIDANRLVDRRSINIDMDFLAVRRKGIDPAGDAVVKARAEADHEIRLVHRHIGFKRAVHAQHAQPFVGRCRKGTQTHQRRGDRASHQFGEFPQRFACLRAAVDDATAGIKDRCFRAHDHFGGGVDRLEIPLGLGLVAAVALGRVPGEFCCRHLDILGNVDDHRTRTAPGRDMKGFPNDMRQIGRLFHQIIMLGAVARDTDRVGFLKGVGADQVGCDLAGDDHHRNTVHQRIGNAGDRIGCARAGCYQHDARLAGGTGIAFRCMGRGLFVADQYVLDLGMLVKRIIYRQHCTARIAEDGIHIQVQQGFDQYVGAALFGHIMLQ